MDYLRIVICLMPGNAILVLIAPDLKFWKVLLIGITLFFGGIIYTRWDIYARQHK